MQKTSKLSWTCSREQALEAIAYGNRAQWGRNNGIEPQAVYNSIRDNGLSNKGNLDSSPSSKRSPIKAIYFVVGTHFNSIEEAQAYALKNGMSENGIASVTQIMKPKTVWENTNV